MEVGANVRLKSDPTRVGVFTGKTQKIGYNGVATVDKKHQIVIYAQASVKANLINAMVQKFRDSSPYKR